MRGEKRTDRVTSHDVAAEAGVSQATVARVFSSPDKVAAPTQDRVRQAAAKLGYVPNYLIVGPFLLIWYPFLFSVGDERGLANCPAIRPTFTTGTFAPKVSTIAICNITLKVSRMLSAENS